MIEDHEPLCMKKNDLKHQVAAAIQACLDKKAEELSILEMEKGSGAFTDYFVLCSGTNPRQVQAIADEVELRLKAAGLQSRARGRIQAGGVDTGGLRGLRRPRFFRESAQVLRSGASVENGEAAGAVGAEAKSAGRSR